MNIVTRQISRRVVALTVTLTLALAAAAMAAPKSERAGKRFTIEGRVLEINQKARTLLVSDIWSKQLYLVNVPEGNTFRITFGFYMNLTEPEFYQVRKNDRVRMQCIRSEDHLARLDDGREVIALTVVR